MAYKGKDVKLEFYDGSALYDISPDAGDGSINFAPQFEPYDVFNTDYTRRVPIRTDASVRLGTLYYGENGENVRAASRTASKANNSAMAVTMPFGTYVGKVMPEGFEVTTPFDNYVTALAEMPSNGGIYYSVATGEANLSLTAANLPSKPADSAYSDIWVVIDSTATQTATLTIGSSTPIVANSGIYQVQNLPSAPTQFKASVAPTGTVKVRFLYVNKVGV